MNKADLIVALDVPNAIQTHLWRSENSMISSVDHGSLLVFGTPTVLGTGPAVLPRPRETGSR